MYYIVMLLGFLLLMLKVNNHKKEIVFLGLLVILAVFRYGVGADYFAYHYLYLSVLPNAVSELNNSVSGIEPIFKGLMILFRTMGISYQVFISVIAIFNLSLIYYTSRRFYKNSLVTMILFYSFFYFVWIFSGLRQGITLSIVFYLVSYYSMKDKDKFIYVFLMLLSLIHYSVLVVAPIYFLSKRKYSIKYFAFAVLIGYFFSLIPLSIILREITWLPLSDKIAFYFSDSTISWGINFQLIGRLFFILIGLLIYTKGSQKNEFSRRILNFYLIGLIMYVFLNNMTLINARLAIYSFMFVCPILAQVWSELLDKKYAYRKVMVSSIVVLSIIYLNKELTSMVRNSRMVSDTKIVRYSNVFNQKEFSFDSYYLNLINKKAGRIHE